jgi:hypothetical protein
MQTIPTTFGFPMPTPGYLPAVKVLCERYGALSIADKVRTGLMHTGTLWGIEGYGVTADIIVASNRAAGGRRPSTPTMPTVFATFSRPIWYIPTRVKAVGREALSARTLLPFRPNPACNPTTTHPDIREIFVSGDIALGRLFWTLTTQKGFEKDVTVDGAGKWAGGHHREARGPPLSLQSG